MLSLISKANERFQGILCDRVSRGIELIGQGTYLLYACSMYIAKPTSSTKMIDACIHYRRIECKIEKHMHIAEIDRQKSIIWHKATR